MPNGVALPFPSVIGRSKVNVVDSPGLRVTAELSPEDVVVLLFLADVLFLPESRADVDPVDCESLA